MNRPNIIKKLFITFGLYILYLLGRSYSLVSTAIEERNLFNDLFGTENYSLFALGFIPAITGFFLIEIIFLIIPSLRVIRNNGPKGRALITKWSLVVSIAIAIFQGQLMARGIEALAENPSFMQLQFYSSFFVVGFVMLLYIGNLISQYGIGNGFCLITGLSLIEKIYQNVIYYFQHINDNNIQPNYIGWLIFFVLAFFLFNIIFKKNWMVPIHNEAIENISLPFFLQGAVSLTFASSVTSLALTLQLFGLNVPQFPSAGTWGYAIILFALTFIASIFGYWLFSGKKRIATNLSLNENSIQLGHQLFIQSTIVLSLLNLVFNMPFPLQDQLLIPNILPLFLLINLIAIGIDIYGQCKFEILENEIFALCELDNVYLAAVLKAELSKANISHSIQGYQYRRLYFFFQPFVKMRLLVACKDREVAWSIVQKYGIKNI